MNNMVEDLAGGSLGCRALMSRTLITYARILLVIGIYEQFELLHHMPTPHAACGESLDLTSKGFVASSRLEITISGRPYDAYKLATECMEAWERYLRDNQISFPDL